MPLRALSNAMAAAIRQPGGAEAVQLKVAEKAVDAYSKVGCGCDHHSSSCPAT